MFFRLPFTELPTSQTVEFLQLREKTVKETAREPKRSTHVLSMLAQYVVQEYTVGFVRPSPTRSRESPEGQSIVPIVRKGIRRGVGAFSREWRVARMFGYYISGGLQQVDLFGLLLPPTTHPSVATTGVLGWSEGGESFDSDLCVEHTRQSSGRLPLTCSSTPVLGTYSVPILFSFVVEIGTSLSPTLSVNHPFHFISCTRLSHFDGNPNLYRGGRRT